VADLAGGGGQNRTAGGQSHPLPPPGYGPAISSRQTVMVYDNDSAANL
jgi:hypothetical protein